MEESITSQLIDQRVVQPSGAPSTAADSSLSADNQWKLIYKKKKKKHILRASMRSDTEQGKRLQPEKTHTYTHRLNTAGSHNSWGEETNAFNKTREDFIVATARSGKAQILQ